MTRESRWLRVRVSPPGVAGEQRRAA